MDKQTPDPKGLTDSLDDLQATLSEAAASLGKLDADALAGLVKQLQQLARTVTDQMTPAILEAGKASKDTADKLREQFHAALDAIVDMAGLAQDRIAVHAGGPSPAREMAAASAPPTPGKAKLGDDLHGLDKQLQQVDKATKDMEAADASPLVAALDKIAAAARLAGPELAKLLKADPAAGKALEERFQAVIDKANEMAAAVKRRAAELDAANRKDNAHQAAQTIHKTADAVTGNVSGSSVGGTLGGLAGPEGAVIGAAIGGAFDQITAAIKGATDALSGFIASSVQAANPGVWDRYQRAVQDFGAVFGAAFAPLIDMATEWTDKLNGVLSQIAPVIGDMVSEIVADLAPVIDAVMGVFEQLADSFKALWADIGPTFKEVMEDIAAAIVVVIKNVQFLINLLSALAVHFAKTGKIDFDKAAKDAAAIDKKEAEKGKKAQDDKTFAARPADFTGIEDVGKSVQLAFASLGTGPTKKTADEATNDISDKIGEMQAALAALGGGMFQLFSDVSKIARVLANPVGSAVSGTQDAIKAAAGGGSLSWDEFRKILFE